VLLFFVMVDFLSTAKIILYFLTVPLPFFLHPITLIINVYSNHPLNTVDTAPAAVATALIFISVLAISLVGQSIWITTVLFCAIISVYG